MRFILGDETFWDLLHNAPHWEFEIFLMALFDGVIGAAAIPLFKRWLKAHDTKKHAHEHCDDAHGDRIDKAA